jgi:hypothetical protein
MLTYQLGVEATDLTYRRARALVAPVRYVHRSVTRDAT